MRKLQLIHKFTCCGITQHIHNILCVQVPILFKHFIFYNINSIMHNLHYSCTALSLSLSIISFHCCVPVYPVQSNNKYWAVQWVTKFNRPCLASREVASDLLCKLKNLTFLIFPYMMSFWWCKLIIFIEFTVSVCRTVFCTHKQQVCLCVHLFQSNMLQMIVTAVHASLQNGHCRSGKFLTESWLTCLVRKSAHLLLWTQSLHLLKEKEHE